MIEPGGRITAGWIAKRGRARGTDAVHVMALAGNDEGEVRDVFRIQIRQEPLTRIFVRHDLRESTRIRHNIREVHQRVVLLRILLRIDVVDGWCVDGGDVARRRQVLFVDLPGQARRLQLIDNVAAVEQVGRRTGIGKFRVGQQLVPGIRAVARANWS